jgi:ABC-type dipeptide/oligopeptide/nickel transport system ATPase subunit
MSKRHATVDAQKADESVDSLRGKVAKLEAELQLSRTAEAAAAEHVHELEAAMMTTATNTAKLEAELYQSRTTEAAATKQVGELKAMMTMASATDTDQNDAGSRSRAIVDWVIMNRDADLGALLLHSVHAQDFVVFDAGGKDRGIAAYDDTYGYSRLEHANLDSEASERVKAKFNLMFREIEKEVLDYSPTDSDIESLRGYNAPLSSKPEAVNRLFQQRQRQRCGALETTDRSIVKIAKAFAEAKKKKDGGFKVFNVQKNLIACVGGVLKIMEDDNGGDLRRGMLQVVSWSRDMYLYVNTGIDVSALLQSTPPLQLTGWTKTKIAKDIETSLCDAESREFFITTIMRRVLGHVPRTVLALLGEGGKGKTTVVKLILSGFGRYACTGSPRAVAQGSTNADEAAMAKRDPDATVMLLDEIRKNIDEDAIKTLGNASTRVVRGAGGDESLAMAPRLVILTMNAEVLKQRFAPSVLGKLCFLTDEKLGSPEPPSDTFLDEVEKGVHASDALEYCIRLYNEKVSNGANLSGGFFDLPEELKKTRDDIAARIDVDPAVAREYEAWIRTHYEDATLHPFIKIKTHLETLEIEDNELFTKARLNKYDHTTVKKYWHYIFKRSLYKRSCDWPGKKCKENNVFKHWACGVQPQASLS